VRPYLQTDTDAVAPPIAGEPYEPPRVWRTIVVVAASAGVVLSLLGLLVSMYAIQAS
jgi:hypothetical protein